MIIFSLKLYLTMLCDASIEDAEFIGRTRNSAIKYMIDQKVINLALQREWFLTQRKKFYIIVINNQKIGYVSHDPKLKEVGICLLPKWRNKGYGSKALSELISRLSKPLYLRVLASNKRAIKIYEKLGFIVAQIRDDVTHMSLLS